MSLDLQDGNIDVMLWPDLWSDLSTVLDNAAGFTDSINSHLIPEKMILINCFLMTLLNISIISGFPITHPP